MDLGGRRVMIGFRGSRAIATLESDGLVVDDGARLVMETAVALPSVFALDGGDVASEIQRRKAQDAIPEAAVAASNIADGEVSPAALDPAGDPLDVPRGGTGLSNVPEGALLFGAGAAAAVPAPHVAFVGNDTLETPSLTVGAWTYAAVSAADGRRTLTATDSQTGASVDLLLPAKRELTSPDLTLTPSSGQVTMQASVSDPLVRVVHFDWRPSPSVDPSPSAIAHRPSKSVVVGPDGLAAYTATGLPSGADRDFRAVAEDGRGNVSPPAKATGAAS